MSVESPQSDADLLQAVRGGNAAAYGKLYERHVAAARALARQLASTEAEVDDVVDESFTKILDLVGRGGGPDAGFRPYLLTVVRRTVHDRTRVANREVMTGAIGAYDPGLPFVDPALVGLERSLIAKAFLTLPERWRAVLWHTEVERARPADVAPLLGLSTNGVAALAYRAREGLRQAYLQMHLAGHLHEDCRPVVAKLGAHVRKGLTRRESKAVDQHVRGCPDCRAVVLELSDVNRGLRVIVGPLITGPIFAGYAAALAKATSTRTGRARGSARTGADGGAFGGARGGTRGGAGGSVRGGADGGAGGGARGGTRGGAGDGVRGGGDGGADGSGWGREAGGSAGSGWGGRTRGRAGDGTGDGTGNGTGNGTGGGAGGLLRGLRRIRRTPLRHQAVLAGTAAIAVAATVVLTSPDDQVERPFPGPPASAEAALPLTREPVAKPYPRDTATAAVPAPLGRPRLHATIGALGALVRAKPGIVGMRLRNSGAGASGPLEAAVALPPGVTALPAGGRGTGVALNAPVAAAPPVNGPGAGAALNAPVGAALPARVALSAPVGAVPPMGGSSAGGVLNVRDDAAQPVRGNGAEGAFNAPVGAPPPARVALSAPVGAVPPVGGRGAGEALNAPVGAAWPVGGRGAGRVLDAPVGTVDGWVCRAVTTGARCARGPLSAGQGTALFLRVQVSALAPQGAGPAVRIRAGSLRVDAHAPAGVGLAGAPARFATDGKVAVNAIGNSLLSCPEADDGCAEARQRAGDRRDNDLWPMVALDQDESAATGASSGARLDLPENAQIVWAGLYWSAAVLPAGPIKIRPPGRKRYLEVLPGEVMERELPSGPGYQAFADVTALVSNAGRDGVWWAADPPMAEGISRHAGWSLVVISTDPAQPYSHAVVLDTATMVGGTHDLVRIPLGGLGAPGAPARAELVTWEGDADLAGDKVSLGSGPLVPASGDRDAGNVFDGSSNGAGGLTFGVDVDTFRGPLGAVPALGIASGKDAVLFGIAAVSVRARS